MKLRLSNRGGPRRQCCRRRSRRDAIPLRYWRDRWRDALISFRSGFSGSAENRLMTVVFSERFRPIKAKSLHHGQIVEAEEAGVLGVGAIDMFVRSEEHTSELQSLMRISYAVFCLKNKKKRQRT